MIAGKNGGKTVKQGIILAAAIALSSPALAQTEVNGVCLCQYGNDPTKYMAEIMLTPANRDAVRKLIETGVYAPGRVVKATAKACEPAQWRKPGLCGTVKVTTFNTGKPVMKEYDNVVVIGSRTIRLEMVGSLSIKFGPYSQVTFDEARWAKLPALQLIGTERK
jgi:hypothetical protein